jgi:hypothetical protein
MRTEFAKIAILVNTTECEGPRKNQVARENQVVKAHCPLTFPMI